MTFFFTLCDENNILDCRSFTEKKILILPCFVLTSFIYPMRKFKSIYFFQENLIKIEIHISDVLVINDRDFSITYSLYFNVQWWDPRIHVNTGFFQDR